MAFVSWDASIADLKDKIADHITNGTALVGQVHIRGDNEIHYRSLEEAFSALAKMEALKSLDTAGSVSTRVSYGKHRNF